MRRFLVTFLLVTSTLPLFAGNGQKLGGLMSKYYALMKQDDQALVLITFEDRGANRSFSPSAAPALLSARAIQRRLKMRSPSKLIDESDLPLDQSYVSGVASHVTTLRHQLKWFNGVSALATRQQIDELLRLSFVKQIDLVGRWRRNKSEDPNPVQMKEQPSLPSPQGTTTIDYGSSFAQNNLIHVPPVHDRGIFGQGVLVGVFDNGVRNPLHQVFDSMNIIATHDFVDHKVSVVPNNPSTGFGSHGVYTLSLIGGYRPGHLIGPAFKASFILARTENDSSETPIEEDNWAAAIQWADSIGVDVTSTSLGYLTYDSPYPSLTWQDMNGQTALITRAADHAVSLGIVVVNSAGNNGPNTSHNTLNAPADGMNVITVGAVYGSGAVTGYSSVGPTTDIPPRIKPDVMAMGSGVFYASSTDTVNYYNAVGGTSFSCPLSAGVAALVLSAHPTLTPFQVREALRKTASNASSPNNTYGWGILNADSAVGYWEAKGTIFNDLNGDSTREPGETGGLSGFTVQLTGDATATTTTDSLGRFNFGVLPFGTYHVAEVLPPGWVKTIPQFASYDLTIDSITAPSGLNFGNFHVSSITGIVYEDMNGNGHPEIGDAGLAGRTVYLSGNASAATVTDLNGGFSFQGLAPGLYTVSDSLPSEWIRTHGPVTIQIRSGLDTTNIAIGSFHLGSIGGIVFNDTNKNGTLDGGEPGLSGWMIINGDTLETDTSGHFRFLHVGPGSKQFRTNPPFGWVQSLPPSNAGYTITMRSGLDTSGLDFGNFYSPGFVYPVTIGWNLLSLPQSVADHRKPLLYPASASDAFIFQGSYKITDTIPNSVGYWIKFAYHQNIFLPGTERSTDSVMLQQGWNMIGSLSSDVNTASILESPGSIIQSNYFRYSPDSGYIPSTTLIPHHGYWVKSASAGTIYLSTTAAANVAKTAEDVLSQYNTLTITDGLGRSQTLYFGAAKIVDPAMLEMPPIPPAGVFDARFAGNLLVADNLSSAGESLPILIANAKYPLSIEWETKHAAGTGVLHYGGRSIPLVGNGRVVAASPAGSLRLSVAAQLDEETPKEFSLSPNYPNPFNPTTTIEFTVPVSQWVSIRLFNLLGQQVGMLVNEVKQPGRYTAIWNAAQMPSGVYYCEFIVGSLRIVRSMVLAK